MLTLYCGSTTRHFQTNRQKFSDQMDSFDRVVYGLSHILLIKAYYLYSVKGGSFSAISIAVIPMDQISVLVVYLLFIISSGLIQNGVPITLSLLAKVYSSYVDIPKSPSLILPESVSNMLPALMSQCIIHFECS